jgi:AraC-like DNA-binding protein
MPVFNTLHCPVTGIYGAWRFERGAGQNSVSRSTPGHLLHFVETGSTILTINERTYHVTPGTIVYYHEQEEVRNHYLQDMVFFSIAFSAPDLPPLPLKQRVFKSANDISELFTGIYNLYNTPEQSPNLHIFSLLLKLLDQLGFTSAHNTYSQREKNWMQIEAWIRNKRKFRASIQDVCEEFDISPATLHRLCNAVSGKSPAKRIQQIRLEESKALLMFSGLNVSEVAEYLGYPRIHEFSREFSTFFKQSPSSLRHL